MSYKDDVTRKKRSRAAAKNATAKENIMKVELVLSTIQCILGRFILSLALYTLFLAQAASAQVITTFAGGGPNNIPATSVGVASPDSVEVDAIGNFYIADSIQHRVLKVDTSGQMTVVAGIGTLGFSGDGGLATNASLTGPSGVALDGTGNLFIADTSNQRIRRVDAVTGIITTVAGSTSSQGFAGDGGLATSARLSNPNRVALDSVGNLFITDANNQRIRRVDAATGIITTVAGNGSFGFNGDGIPATSASLANPRGLALDGSGNLFIADTSNGRIRRVDAATGIITTFRNAAEPFGIAVDSAGNLFFSERSSNHLIRRVDAATGITTRVAGNFTAGFSGDGGPATSASLSTPIDIAVDTVGNLFIADVGNRRIRKVDSTGTITTVAGNGSANFSGDGSVATNASLRNPRDVALDSAGNLFIADQANARIRRVDAVTGIITTVAGRFDCFQFSGDGGLATNACLRNPVGVALDSADNLFIADETNRRIRRVDAITGIIITVAGDGNSCSSTTDPCGDGWLATNARLTVPSGVALDGAGNLFIADSFSRRIRMVNGATGIITTVAGGAPCCALGDGGPATSATLQIPIGVALDSAGNLFIADNIWVRRVDAVTGIITTVAGGGPGPLPFVDGNPATSYHLRPTGVALDSADNLFIADQISQRVLRVNAGPDGKVTGGVGELITTVAGNGIFGFSGDGGPATNARLANPFGLAIDAANNLFIADFNNNRIRHVIIPVSPPSSTFTTTLVVIPASGTYGGATNLSATLTSGGSPVSGRTISFTVNGVGAGSGTTNAGGVATVTGASLSGINAATYLGGIEARFAGDADFTLSSGLATLTVNPAPLTVTADSKTKTYGSANPPLTGSLMGVVAGDAITASYSTTATVSSPVGTFPITPQLVDPNGKLSNYTVSSTNGTLTVTKATPVITWGNPVNITYPTPLSGTQLNATANVAGSFAYTPPAGTVLNAGNGQTLSALFTPSDTTNYNNANASVLINVLKASSTVTLSGTGSFVYDGLAHGATASVSGVGGLNQSLTVSYTGACSAPPVNVAETPCTVSAAYAGNPNHEGSSASGTITITQAGSTTTVSGGTFTYDGNPHPATVLVTGAGGLSLSPAPSYSGGCSAAPVNVGETTPTPCTASYTYPGDGNHSGSSGSALIVINKAAATLSVSGGSFIYDGTSKSATVTITPIGLTGVSVTYNGSPTAPTNAGTYAVVASLANGNYTAPDATATLVIDKAMPVITWSNPADIVYGTPLSGTHLNATANVAGSFAYTPPAGTVLNAGNGQTLSALFTPTDTNNYNTAAVNVLINVLKAPQTIVFGALPGKNLGDPSFTVSATGGGSGNPVTFVAGPGSVCNSSGTNGSTITIVGGGLCTVTASQVGDSNYEPAPDAQQSFNVNLPPVANAGSDQTVDEWTPVTLNGTASQDPDGGALSYAWSQLAGTTVTLDLTNPAQPTFTAPLVSASGDVLTFQLVVSDGQLNSLPAIMNVTVTNVNKYPIAQAGNNQTVNEATVVTLNGSASYDPDGETITYAWSQTGGPTVTLTGDTTAAPTFTAPLVGFTGATLTFALTVTDPLGAASNPDTVSVTVENVNHAPVANAGSNQTVSEATLVTLNGTGSSDPDGDSLSFNWTQISGSAVVLSSATSPTPSFTAPTVGPGGAALTFRLTVSDTLATNSNDVTVTVLNVNDAPVCNLARTSLAVLWPPTHILVPVSIIGVTDPNNDGVAIAITRVTQDERVNGLGDGDTSPDAVIQSGQVLLRAERAGNGNGRVYQIQFTAADGQGGSCAGSVNVGVPHNMKAGGTAVDNGQLYDSTVP